MMPLTNRTYSLSSGYHAAPLTLLVSGHYFAVLMISSLWLLSLDSYWASPLLSDELCDNAIDDDGDGLIDLNDEECACSIINTTSLIPNPSFEEKDCCPGLTAQLDCAKSWIQASAAYVHYFHECAFSNRLIPLPIPDGEGVVALLDGKANEISNYKEYIGACLTTPLKANVPHRFRFDIGFSEILTPIPMDVSLFGTPNCEYLPFGGEDPLIGCPTNTPNWVYLGKVKALPVPTGWKRLEISFTPALDIAAIAIGPPCAINDLRDDSKTAYYFFDNLTLNEAFNFDFKIEASDHPCSADLTLEVPTLENLEYQWYKDGIALVGETRPTLQRPPGAGTYQVRIDNGNTCHLSPSYEHNLPTVSTELRDTICEGDIYTFGTQMLEAPGHYQDTLKSIDNCDSIRHLELVPSDAPSKVLSVKIFPSERIRIGNYESGEVGDHVFILDAMKGCDTIVQLKLENYSVHIPNVFSPNDDGINDTFTIYGGEELQMILSLQVFDRWGTMVFQQKDLMPNQPHATWDGTLNGVALPQGVFVYVATLLMDDMKSRTITGDITLLR